MCQRLSDEFVRAGMDCDCLHGDVRQNQREKTMQRFRSGNLAVLIATDVASRGIDVDDVDCVINFDIPEENEYYVHRIGMQRFRSGNLAVLIATDVASRGIDVDDVDCVINFDIPEENEYYVHRIGRTGRAKRKGQAWSLIGNFPEKAKLDEIAKFSNYTIQPMILADDDTLTKEIVKAPAPIKRRFR